jgi:branched-chain amino acid aminotransferase
MAHLKTSSLPYAYFEGKIVKTEEAKVSIMTNALQYGTSIFSGMRAYYNEKQNYLSLFRIDDHIKRFLQSLQIIGVSLAYNEKEIKKITLNLLQKNSPKTDTYIRPFAYASSLNLSPNLERDHQFEFAEYMIPLGDYIPTDKGVTVMVSSWRRMSDNAIPSRAKASGAYINSALAKKEAMQNGYDEAIFLTEQGSVAEGSAMNIFIVRDGVLITPQKTDDVLEGIVRRSVIEIAKNFDIPVEERTIDRSELYIADEAFFSGTGAQVAWISEIDKRQIGTGKRGKITSKLQNIFFRIVKGEEESYKNWCTIL